jgi:hypothetical protein
MNPAIATAFGDQSRAFHAIIRLGLRCTTAVEFSGDFQLGESGIARDRHSAVTAIDQQLSTIGDRGTGDDSNAAVVGVCNNAVCNGDTSGDSHQSYD